MIQVTLQRIESSHRNLRTDEVTGVCKAIPEVGKDFVLYSAPLQEGMDLRLIHTTTVKQVQWVWQDHIMMFKTENSTYMLNIKVVAEC